MMKKYLSFALVILTLLAFCACEEPVTPNAPSTYDTPEHGVTNDVERAALAAFEALYIDCDEDAYFKADLTCNEDLVDKYIKGDRAEEACMEAIAECKKTASESIAENKAMFSKYEKFSMGYDIRYSVIYSPGEKTFDDTIKFDFLFNGVAEYKNLIESSAVVGIAAERYMTVDGKNQVSAKYIQALCFKIGGTWYVGKFS